MAWRSPPPDKWGSIGSDQRRRLSLQRLRSHAAWRPGLAASCSFGYNANVPDNAPPTSHVRIDAAELSRVDVSDDGTRLCLRLRDQAGKAASVSLPADCLNAVLTALPRGVLEEACGGQGPVHRLDGWSLRQAEHGLLLTLSLSDGASITFAVKPWQIAAIASLAGQDRRPAGQRLN